MQTRITTTIWWNSIVKATLQILCWSETINCDLTTVDMHVRGVWMHAHDSAPTLYNSWVCKCYL